jgi:hypothetical protein
MKLQELESRTKTQQSLKVFESQFGQSLAVTSISPKQASAMLRKVRGLIREHRNTSEFHRSERNPAYLKLMMMEQALVNRLGEAAPQSMQRVGKAAGEVLGAGIGFALGAIPGALIGGLALGPGGAIGGGLGTGLPVAMTGTTLGGSAGRQAANFTHDALVNAWRKVSAKLGGPEATAEFIKAHARAADYGYPKFEFGGKDYQVTMDRMQARKAMNDLAKMSAGGVRESQPGAAPGMAMAQQDPAQAAAAASGVRKVATATGQGSQANLLGKAIDTAVQGKTLDPRQRAALGTQLGGLQKAMSDPSTATRLQQMLKTATAAESKKARGRRLREASELQQAQVVLAAQDMVDQIQKMIEQVSAMQFKDLPALVDSIRNDVGMDQAQQFNNDVTAALQGLIQGLQGSKTQLETAQGVLTGQAPVVPGQDAGAAGAPAIPGGAVPGADTGEVDMDADLDLDANLPPEDSEELPPAKALGRDRR